MSLDVTTWMQNKHKCKYELLNVVLQEL